MNATENGSHETDPRESSTRSGRFFGNFEAMLRRAIGNRYEIIGEVARGGMGVVYRGRHRILNQDVAIKVILPGQSVDRFLREARLLANVKSPHVVAVHDCELLDASVPVLVMEWVDGHTLLERMKLYGGRVPESVAVEWMKHTCQGMRTAEEREIVHRDLKPSNIMIDGGGRAMVMDFGLARESMDAPALSMSSDVLGTAYYMSPEQAESPRRVDTRADVYSFGATYYHALTGRPMFTGESIFSVLFKHRTQPPVSPASINEQLSQHTSQLIERCVAKSPDERFQSFSELLGHLEATAPSASPWDDLADPALDTYMAQYMAQRSSYLDRGHGPAVDDPYCFPGARVLRILDGNVVEQEVEAVVSSDDESLSMGGGVSAAIRRSAGRAVYQEAQVYVPVRQGRVVVTSAGNMAARFVFHAVTLDYRSAKLPSRDVIGEIIDSCFYHAETLNLKSIALPLLATGTGGFEPDICLDTMFRKLVRLLARRPTCLKDVRIVLFRPGRTSRRV